ncbi:MAG: DUF4440 domain-containing protein [Vicinamibacteraceae bacterium]
MPIVRRTVVMLACAAALVVPGPGRLAAQSAQPAPSAARATPTDALQAWVDAFNSRDPKRIVARYAPNAVFWGTTAKAIATTPAQVWDYFKDAGQRPSTRVTIDSTHQRIAGDVAVISGAYTFADVKDGASTNVRPARYTLVFQKIGDAWLIIDHHSSRVPEP